MPLPKFTDEKILGRILDRVEETEAGCWLWPGARDSNGYGIVNVRGTNTFVHRFVWEQFVGPIPEGMLLRHQCSVKPCCCPDHLQTGTQSENMLDAYQNGERIASRHRINAGCSNGQAVLTDEKVLEARLRHAAGEKTAALRLEYGVSQSVMDFALTGRTWKHVGGPLRATRPWGPGKPKAK